MSESSTEGVPFVEGEPSPQQLPALPEQPWKAKLLDGAVIASAGNEQSCVTAAAAFYSAFMVISPHRPFQIGCYDSANRLQVVIGRGV